MTRSTSWSGSINGLAFSHSTFNSALYNSCASAFYQFSILHFGILSILSILSILFILSQFPAGIAMKALDSTNRIYRIKSFGSDLGQYIRVLR